MASTRDDDPEASRRPRLGERLIARGLLSQSHLDVALKEQRRTKDHVGRILVSLGFVSEEDLARVLFEDADVEFVSLRDRVPDPGLCDRFDLEFLRNNLFVPLSSGPGGFEIVMANPSDVYTADIIQKLVDRPLVVRGSTKAAIVDAIVREAHRRRQGDDAAAETHEAVDPVAVDAVDSMLQRAVELDATDVHVEPEERLLRVRYRVDGVLVPGDNLAQSLTRSLVTRIKILANLDITESRTPQDGRIAWSGPFGPVDLRVSVFPCVQGETIVMRLLDHSGSVPSLDRLGMPAELVEELRRLVSTPHGMLYVTGPTGSGKSTSLYSLLATLDPMERKICTVEDPVEYRLPLIRQCQINADIGLDFASALRSLLRQDPDLIMIGEIRDFETAEIAVQSSLTGHLVFSTLHTNTAIGAITRLRDMGVEPYLIAASLSGVLGQRLVRRLCTDCARPTPPDAAERDLFVRAGVAVPELVHAPVGCEACQDRGYRGRTGVFEFFAVDEALREVIAREGRADVLTALLRERGFRSMYHHALNLVVRGVTSLKEVFRVIPETDRNDLPPPPDHELLAPVEPVTTRAEPGVS